MAEKLGDQREVELLAGARGAVVDARHVEIQVFADGVFRGAVDFLRVSNAPRDIEAALRFDPYIRRNCAMGELRYDRFEARPAGVRAMLPHVDRFLPVHNLKSLIDLARVMREPADRSAYTRRCTCSTTPTRG